MTPLDQLVDRFARRPPKRADDTDRARAAVAVLLVAAPDRVLLIHRAERAGDPWSGHLALPGGRVDPTDRDLLATAVRETQEETAIVLDRRWCRAELDDLAPLTVVLPRILVRPFLFILPEALAGLPSDEVVRADWVEFAELTRGGVFGPRVLDIRGEPRTVDGYQLTAGFLWGMTERILTPIIKAWKELSAGAP